MHYCIQILQDYLQNNTHNDYFLSFKERNDIQCHMLVTNRSFTTMICYTIMLTEIYVMSSLGLGGSSLFSLIQSGKGAVNINQINANKRFLENIVSVIYTCVIEKRLCYHMRFQANQKQDL